MKAKLKKRYKIAVISVVSVLVLIITSTIGVLYYYFQDNYRADSEALQDVTEADLSIQIKKDMTVFYPKEKTTSETALIFYPGAKIEYKAYAPLLTKISQRGITCILFKMPFNLAVFDVNEADEEYNTFPQIKHWYIAGHSLGGAMASRYAGKNSSKLSGLILLGAYPVNDSSLPTLVIYGSEDKILDKSKLVNVKNIMVIEGGNHAQFGNYGEQKGDGTATITRNEQQKITVDDIIKFIDGGIK